MSGLGSRTHHNFDGQLILREDSMGILLDDDVVLDEPRVLLDVGLLDIGQPSVVGSVPG